MVDEIFGQSCSADIYWMRLHPETPAKAGVMSAYHLWKPWIGSLCLYHPPVDPPHCTLFYVRYYDEEYLEDFKIIDG